MNSEHSSKRLVNGIPFVNDKQVIGRWEYFDVVETEANFDVRNRKKPHGKKGYKEIFFLPNGQKYWIFEGWTKGSLFVHYGGDEPVIRRNYRIEEIDGDMYMFLEVKADSQNDEGGYINILKKTSNREYCLSEIGVRDNIDLPFIMDHTVLGKWKSIDYVKKINDFDVSSSSSSHLWLKSVTFNKDGTAIREYDDQTWLDNWTLGILIDQQLMTASSYEIKQIDNREFLFLEWKRGNYVYGGAKAAYYVFERKNI